MPRNSGQKPESEIMSEEPKQQREDYVCLDGHFSTSRRLFRSNASAVSGRSICKDSCGGLRLKGYYKKSFRETPLITIVTVVLNDPDGLEKTINSVIEQSYENVEFLIIDGGSTDSTLKIIEKYEDMIDYWLSEPDKGIYDAMNKGIDYANGDWINFLNTADTFHEKSTLEKVFRNSRTDADFIYGHTYFLGGDFQGIVKAWDFDILWKTMIFTHQSLFTRSGVLKKRKFDINFRICADYDIIFNSYMEGLRFHNSDTVIAAFDPGTSDFSRARMAFEKWSVVRKHRNDLEFHWFYLNLFLKRLFRDLGKRFAAY